MSLISTFVDAFKKAAGKKPPKSEIDMKTPGPLGSTTEEGGKSFTPLRPTPAGGSGQGIDSGDLSVWVRLIRRRAANRAPASSLGEKASGTIAKSTRSDGSSISSLNEASGG